MNRQVAAAFAAAMLIGPAPAWAQPSTPASPKVGSPVLQDPVGPPAPRAELLRAAPRSGPVPPRLSLAQALDEAFSRSPGVIAAEAEVAAAEARGRQAGFRENPQLSIEVENFAGTGELKGLRSAEATVSVNQRLDLGGRRSARVGSARAEINLRRLALAVARADVAREVRVQFATAIAARDRLAQAEENVELSKELARVTGILVDAGRDPPLRGIRARSALAQAEAEREAARADELAARTSLAALLGSTAPIEEVTGSPLDIAPTTINVEQSLEVRVAEAEAALARAELEVQLAERRLDPAVGVGVRHVRETGDFGLVAGVSVPLQLFNRNQGNIAAARASIAAAESRQRAALVGATARGRNAISAVEAAGRRVTALYRSAVPEAREALRLAQLSYTEGRSTLVELLDAQNAYLSTQAALTDAELALATATAELGRIAAQ